MFSNILINNMPKIKTAKKISIFHAFVLKNVTISFQIFAQSIFSPSCENYNPIYQMLSIKNDICRIFVKHKQTIS